MLGIGSNAAPEQLKRKFPKSMFSSVVIPVVRCVLVDYDVIYAPLIAGYGSCTGMPNVMHLKRLYRLYAAYVQAKQHFPHPTALLLDTLTAVRAC